MDLLAQQRGHWCRHLLPGRKLDGADVRVRQGSRSIATATSTASPYRNCGKLIVATVPEEPQKLQAIRAHAEANGVLDMQTLAGAAARDLEPALNCDAALLSPSTGIIDSHAYMLSLQGEAEAAGAAFAFHTPLIRARADCRPDRTRDRR